MKLTKKNGALGLLLIIFALAIYCRFTSEDATIRSSEREFAFPDKRALAAFSILAPDGRSLVLGTDDYGRWMVNNQFFANEVALEDLKNILRNMRVRQPVPISQQDSVNLALDNNGLDVSVYVKAHRITIGPFQAFAYNKKLLNYKVGADTPDGESTYMRKENSSMPFMIHVPGIPRGLSSVFDVRENLWRDPVVIDLNYERILAVELIWSGLPVQSFYLKSDPLVQGFDFYQTASQESPIALEADTLKVLRYLSAFEGVHYEMLLDENQRQEAENLMQEQPFVQLYVYDSTGRRTHLEAFRRHLPEGSATVGVTGDVDPNRFYLRVNGADLALAQYFVFNRIFRPLSFFERQGL